MEISQFILAQLWLYAFFLGAGLGAVYDVLSISRVFLGVPFTPWTEQFLLTHSNFLLKRQKKGKNYSFLLRFVSFFEDLLFSLGASIALTLLFFQLNNGQIRVPVILSTLIGFYVYRASFGIIFRPFLELTILSLKNLIHAVIQVLLFPFSKAISAIKKIGYNFYRRSVKKYEQKQRLRFTNAELKKIEKHIIEMI